MLKRALFTASLAAILSGPGLCRAEEPQTITPAPAPDPAAPAPDVAVVVTPAPATPGMTVITSADGQPGVPVIAQPFVARYMQLQAQRQALEGQLQQLKSQGGTPGQAMDYLQARLQEINAQVATITSEDLQHIGYKKGTFLGVAVESAPPELRQQLRLQEGFGLVVEEVTPDSPAAAAGVQQYDVLQKLGDQDLVVPVQLEILVRSYRPGDEIKLSVIRGGQPVTISAKLTEKNLPPLAMIDDGNVPTFRTAHLVGPGASAGGLISVDGDGVVILNRDAGGAVGTGNGTFTSWTDGKQKLTLDGKHLHATDAQTDALIFDGDVDSPDMPPATREKLKTLMSLQPAVRPTRGSGGGGGGFGGGGGAGGFGGAGPAGAPEAIAGIGGGGAGGAMPPPPGVSSVVAGGGARGKFFQAPPGSQMLLKTTGRNILVLTLTDGKPAHLLVQDLAGRTLFDGSVATEQDQEKIPADVRDDFEALRNHPDQAHDLTGK